MPKLNEAEIEFIRRMREFKLARRSTLLHIKEIIHNLPADVKAPLFNVAYETERKQRGMFARMV